jgi:GWxTD domain-containing protein
VKLSSRMSFRFRKANAPGFALGVLLLALAAALGPAPACRLYKMESQLTPPYAEFLAKVQYIITGPERKIFLELPDSEKDKFIDAFWERRNPNPGSKENAFKTEYLDRVQKAGDLFRGEGKEGYLTDRGRIYILFGPPTERLTYPMDAEGYCREIWYYGAFPVIFEDEHCDGRYLITAINLEHLEALNIAQGRFQQTITDDKNKRFFDYNVSVEKGRYAAGRYESRIVVDVPYAAIWFGSKDGRLETTLRVKVEGDAGAHGPVWTFEKSYPLAMSEDELQDLREKSYRIEIPLVLEKELARLKDGRLQLRVNVRNSTEGDDLAKVVELRLKS